MKIGGGLITLIIIVLIAIWAGAKYPSINLLGKVTAGMTGGGS